MFENRLYPIGSFYVYQSFPFSTEFDLVTFFCKANDTLAKVSGLPSLSQVRGEWVDVIYQKIPFKPLWNSSIHKVSRNLCHKFF